MTVMPARENVWTPARLEAVRSELRRRGLDGVLVPRVDVHQGEYCAPRDERLAWLTGFTGSAGCALVTLDEAVLFVDGRYTVQAARQVDGGLIAVDHLVKAPPAVWLRRHGKAGARYGVDPLLVTPNQIDALQAGADEAGAELVETEDNVVDAVWHDQPEPPLGAVTGFERSGTASAAKRRLLVDRIAETDADFLIETLPENIAWLLNVRGADVHNTPAPHSFLIAGRDGSLEWFVDSRKLPNDPLKLNIDGVSVSDPGAFLARVAERAANACVFLDPDAAPAAVRREVVAHGGTVVTGSAPITLAKSVKDEVELAGLRAANLRDSAAIADFLAWLSREVGPRQDRGQPVTELEAAEYLMGRRRDREAFQGPSFATISASGENAALCHYDAFHGVNAALMREAVYLVDAGGQYLNGTTDMTRTCAFGPVSDEVRTNATLVLKSHIALASLRFPAGTYGRQLDSIARAPLWRAGLDYDHGTGHGIGHYLSVHEQPQRIHFNGDALALTASTVMSIEPGYYKAGAYGIRIENLYEVTKLDGDFFGFSCLTFVPIDRGLIDVDMLEGAERAWLDYYHADVRARLQPLVADETQDWLIAATAPI